VPATPYAKVLVSVNGGGTTSGKVTCTFTNTVQLSGENTTGWNTVRWELYDYPIGWSTPAGWSVDANGVFFSTATLPPLLTIPASSNNNWGKVAIRLTINNNPTKIGADGARNAQFNTTQTDEGSILNILSPKGQEGICLGESTQGDTLRSWAGTIMRNLRTLETLLP